MDAHRGVSVVLPAYNEADRIAETVAVTVETLEAYDPAGGFEVIVAEDGCEDRTPEIADRLAREDDRVRHVHSDERLGRGGALEHAFRASTGETVAYLDTDLATDMVHLQEVVGSVHDGTADIAIGSRLTPGAQADRPHKRSIPSLGFNLLVRTLIGSTVQDHQCGFKAFDRAVLFEILADVEDEHWFWDTEVLVRAQRAGYEVREIAVDWEPKGDSKVDLVRDVFGMGSQIARTAWQLRVSPKITPRRSMAAGTLLVIAVLLVMPQYLDFGAVLDELRQADPALVGLAALVYVTSWPLRGTRYRDILVRQGYREDWAFLTGAIFISQTGNLIIPARMGDAIRAYVIKARRGVPYPSGAASLAVERVFDLLTIAVLAGVVLLGVIATGGADALVTALTEGVGLEAERQASAQVAMVAAAAVSLAVVGATIAILVSARTDRNYIGRVVHSLSEDSYARWVADQIRQFVGDVQVVTSDGRTFALVGTTSLAIWTIDVITAVLVLVAFDVAVAPATLLAVGFFAVSVGNLSKVLPLSPGGLGLYEGAFTVIVVALTGLGVPVALGAAILDHAVKNAVTVAGGLVSMLWLNVSLTEAVSEAPDVADEAAVTDD
ncbi:flippase-like domain-containing protein [Halococcoides cellulosivorans]|uniref:Glycosyl transferase n=1 Tax=Halococcoides cellulosivorans TaxID=1679096 RepID=A0A2R4WY24_9EURY|nr:flippase-like domain-containing protein [Halococcoides cellulosivorans]AWB26421.1 glycosyl transferase [Halococcoides cellulosivorans]